jgi:hypothetical protein
METTQIAADRTAAEIQALLGAAGARAILTEYRRDRKIEALNFRLEVNGREIPFRLPVRSEALFKVINGRRAREWRRTAAAAEDRATADRVAWRLCLRWLQAQLAFVATDMLKMEEVFLPYLQVSATETVYQRLAAGGFDSSRMLPEPAERKVQ